MRKSPWVFLTVCLAASLPGCGPILPYEKDDLLTALGAILLKPETSCEELRANFGLTYLPVVSTPGELGIPYEETFVPVDDRFIRLWHLPSPLDRGTVVVSHGSSGGMACYLFVPILLHANGWSVVMYEYAGFGASGGEPSLGTLHRDLEAALDWTLARTGRTQVTLAGISLGSIPSIAVAALRPDEVNALILDSPVVLEEQFERFSPLLAHRPQVFAERLADELRSEKMIVDAPQPILVFMGDGDLLTPPETVDALLALAPGPVTRVTFPELQHALAPYLGTPWYVLHLETFLRGVWPSDERFGPLESGPTSALGGLLPTPG